MYLFKKSGSFLFFLILQNLYFFHVSHAQSNVNLKKIADMMQSRRPPHTVAQFLNRMPDKFLSDYALQFSGLALQKASYDDPRAFLFDLTSGLVATFNNSPYHAQNQEIEIISYNKEIEEFELSEISFKNSKAPEFHRNPPICLSCHQSGFKESAYIRPIFGSLNNWVGFFGGTLLNHQERLKENAGIMILNQKIFNEPAHDKNRYGYLQKLFPFDQNSSTIMKNRPNHQLMNLLQFYNSRSIQMKIKKRVSYKAILPWISLFYFDSKITGISSFGQFNLEELDEKGCFQKNAHVKERIFQLLIRVQDELRKNRIFFLLNSPGRLSLGSIFEGMGFPRTALTMSLGIEQEKKFLIGINTVSPFMVIPSFILKDFKEMYLSNNLQYELIDTGVKSLLLQQGITHVEQSYVKQLESINPVLNLVFKGEQHCADFYNSYGEILEASL